MSSYTQPGDLQRDLKQFDGWLITKQTSPGFLAVVSEAISVISRHFGASGLKRFLPNDSATVGLPFFLPIVDTARLILELERHDSLADDFLRDLRAGKEAETIPVMRVAAALASHNVSFDVEPPVLSRNRLRHPDLKATIDGQDVCIEVTSPDTSQLQSEILRLMDRLTSAFAPFQLPRTVGVSIQDTLTTEAERRLLAICQNVIARADSDDSIEGVTIVTGNDPLEVQQRLRDLSPGAALFSTAGMIGGGTQFVIRAPYSDTRALRVLGDKRRHGQLTVEQANVLVVDVTRVPLMLPDWDLAVRSFLVADKNRRISAIMLLHALTSFRQLEVKFSLHHHPNPYFALPRTLENCLTAYFASAGIEAPWP